MTNDEPADLDIPLVLYDAPVESKIALAMQGRSNAPTTDPAGSQELAGMTEDARTGDEVAYQRRCINGKSYRSSTMNMPNRLLICPSLT